MSIADRVINSVLNLHVGRHHWFEVNISPSKQLPCSPISHAAGLCLKRSFYEVSRLTHELMRELRTCVRLPHSMAECSIELSDRATRTDSGILGAGNSYRKLQNVVTCSTDIFLNSIPRYSCCDTIESWVRR